MFSAFEAPLTNMTLLRYPPTAGEAEFGIHPHKDTNILRFYPDPNGGLEIKSPDGSWVELNAQKTLLLLIREKC